MRGTHALKSYFGRSTAVKVGSGFVLGAALVGGVASAVVSPVPSVKACVDNKTQAMYLSPSGTCAKTRTLVDLGTGGMSVKAVAAAVTPSVVTVSVVSSAGTGTGSGSIIQTSSTSSYIMTNNHVVESAATAGSKMTVEFSNGESADATIVGRDSTYDLAVIKVAVGNLPVIAFGDSSALSIGDPVIAIGSPLGLSSTVTSGIVSALNRPVTTGSTSVTSFIDAIQTDAAINPGNSGGALVDAQGRIVGVNSAIASLSSSSTSQSGSIGLGFSIPINEAKRIANELITTGKSTRPVLGVFFDNTYTGVGAKIASLSPGEGAQVAGIPAGAIIRSIDGFRIADQVSAIVKIRSYAPSSVVSIVADLPNGTTKTFTVTLGSAPSQ
ncbi:MAG: trypsin-like peptidase domain-containing protein [Actinobacteria bacterium]|nr:trypsin-like peptidase domain-containing protein [Actinomycetota bacterium]